MLFGWSMCDIWFCISWPETIKMHIAHLDRCRSVQALWRAKKSHFHASDEMRMKTPIRLCNNNKRHYFVIWMHLNRRKLARPFGTPGPSYTDSYSRACRRARARRGVARADEDCARVHTRPRRVRVAPHKLDERAYQIPHFDTRGAARHAPCSTRRSPSLVREQMMLRT
jgi:hypothetical protein